MPSSNSSTPARRKRSPQRSQRAVASDAQARARQPQAPRQRLGRSLPVTPALLQRYGIFLAPLFLIAGFLLVVSSAHTLLASPASGVVAGAPLVQATDSARAYIHNTHYLTATQNILVLGSDRRPDTPLWRTDVMMILALDRVHNRAAVISIPRDLYVDIPNHGLDRMNTADFFGSGGGNNMDAGAQTVAAIIRRDMGIEIDNYVRIDFDGFKQVIDALGGIDVEVDCPLSDVLFERLVGTLTIEPGVHHMDGTFALSYVRSRRQGGDFDRARRQQRVLMAVRNRAVSINLLPRLPELLPAALRTAQTDLNPLELASLARWGIKLDMANLEGFVIDANMTSFIQSPSGESVLQPDWDLIHQSIAGLFSPDAKPLIDTNDRSWFCPGIDDAPAGQ